MLCHGVGLMFNSHGLHAGYLKYEVAELIVGSHLRLLRPDSRAIGARIMRGWFWAGVSLVLVCG